MHSSLLDRQIITNVAERQNSLEQTQYQLYMTDGPNNLIYTIYHAFISMQKYTLCRHFYYNHATRRVATLQIRTKLAN